MANKIRIDAELVTQVSNLENTKKQIENELNNLKFDFGKDKSFQKLFKSFESEILNFKSLTKDGEIDLLDEKKVSKSGDKIISIFNQIIERQKEIANASTAEKMKFFPEHFTANAKAGLKVIDQYISKYDELAVSVEKATRAERNAKANNTKATNKLNSLLQSANATTQKQFTSYYNNEIQNTLSLMDQMIKKKAEIASGSTATVKTKNNDYNELVKILNLQQQLNQAQQEYNSAKVMAKGSSKEATESRNLAQALVSQKKSVADLEKEYIDWTTALRTAEEAQKKLEAGSDAFKSNAKVINEARVNVKGFGLALNSLKLDETRQKIATAFQLPENFTDENLNTKIQNFISNITTSLTNARKNGQIFTLFSPEEVEQLQTLISSFKELKAMRDSYESATKNKSATAKVLQEESVALEKLKKQFNELKSDSNLDTVFNALKNAGINVSGVDRSIEGLQQLRTQLDGLTDKQIEQINVALEEMRKKAEGAGQSIPKIKTSLGDMSQATASLQQMNSEFEQLKSQAQYFFGLTNSFNLLRRAINGAYETVKKLDAAMTETAVVTDFSVADMWDQLPQYTKMAKELGATTEGAYQTAALFYQQGPILPAGA